MNHKQKALLSAVKKMNPEMLPDRSAVAEHFFSSGYVAGAKSRELLIAVLLVGVALGIGYGICEIIDLATTTPSGSLQDLWVDEL